MSAETPAPSDAIFAAVNEIASRIASPEELAALRKKGVDVDSFQAAPSDAEVEALAVWLAKNVGSYANRHLTNDVLRTYRNAARSLLATGLAVSPARHAAEVRAARAEALVELRAAEQTLQYIAAPTMGRPPGVDPESFAREGAPDAMVRMALGNCIDMATRARDRARLLLDRADGEAKA